MAAPSTKPFTLLLSLPQKHITPYLGSFASSWLFGGIAGLYYRKGLTEFSLPQDNPESPRFYKIKSINILENIYKSLFSSLVMNRVDLKLMRDCFTPSFCLKQPGKGRDYVFLCWCLCVIACVCKKHIYVVIAYRKDFKKVEFSSLIFICNTLEIFIREI